MFYRKSVNELHTLCCKSHHNLWMFLDKLLKCIFSYYDDIIHKNTYKSPKQHTNLPYCKLPFGESEHCVEIRGQRLTNTQKMKIDKHSQADGSYTSNKTTLFFSLALRFLFSKYTWRRNWVVNIPKLYRFSDKMTFSDKTPEHRS